MTYTITLESDQRQFTAAPDETIVDAALRQNISLVYGCRNGACGNCAGKVLNGDIAYPQGRPAALEKDDSPAVRALFCQAVACSDLTIETETVDTPAEIRVKMLPMKVVALDRVASDVVILKLKLPPSERMQFLAGQYIEFVLPDDRRRAFSIANAPHDDAFIELHIRNVQGGVFTDQVFQEMQLKSIVRVAGPYGSFYLREESTAAAILMAGGTGLAPIKGMVEHLLATKSQRQIHIFWGVRDHQDLYLHQQLNDWAAEHAQIRYTPVLSEPDDSEPWDGKTGYVHLAVAEEYPDLSQHQVYMSGPPPMIEAAKQLFQEQLGLSPEHLFYDSFDYSSDALKAIADSAED